MLLRYRVWQTLCQFGSFFALSPYYWPWKLEFGKHVKNAQRCYPFTHVYHKWRSNDIWFLRYKALWTGFFVILGHFCPLTLLATQKINISKKKTPGDVILHLCTTSDNHMMYGSWNIKHSRKNFLSFWYVFCPFTPLTTLKTKFWRNEKNAWRYYHLHLCIANNNHIMYGFSDMEHDRHNFFVILDYFLPFHPLTTQKIKIKKNEEKSWRYCYSAHVCHKWQSNDVWFLRYEAWQTEFFVIFFAIFCSFTPIKPKKSKFWEN